VLFQRKMHLFQVKGEPGGWVVFGWETKMQCTSCQREIFYIGKSVVTGEPQFICSACGQRHSGHIDGMTVTIKPATGSNLQLEAAGDRRR
jgi:hypothetical protein